MEDVELIHRHQVQVVKDKLLGKEVTGGVEEERAVGESWEVYNSRASYLELDGKNKSLKEYLKA